MADLTEGQLAECREVARVIVKEVLIEHIETCTHHLAYLLSRARIYGIAVGVVLASGISSGTVVAIIMKVLI